MVLSGYSSLQMWIRASDATKTMRLMIASDWSNYNIYTVTGLESNTWSLVSINLLNPVSSVGTVRMGSITFVRLEYEVKRESAFFKIDDIRGVY
jgi:hypothetical protein